MVIGGSRKKFGSSAHVEASTAIPRRRAGRCRSFKAEAKPPPRKRIRSGGLSIISIPKPYRRGGGVGGGGRSAAEPPAAAPSSSPPAGAPAPPPPPPPPPRARPHPAPP